MGRAHGGVDLCHSPYHADIGETCEPVATSQGLADSDVVVIGPVLWDRARMVWLAGEAIRTHRHSSKLQRWLISCLTDWRATNSRCAEPRPERS